MTHATLTGMRQTAQLLMSTNSDGYRLETYNESSRTWSVKMFDLTMDRACEYAKYFHLTRIVDRTGQTIEQ